MKRKFATVRSAPGKSRSLCAIDDATPAAVNPQESRAAAEQRRRHNELTFTQVDFPGATATVALNANDRGQIVGAFIDAEGAVHGFLAAEGQFSGEAIGVGSGAEMAAVEIIGSFYSPADLDLSAATLTIASLLDERAGGGELVPRRMPMVLTAVPGSRRNLALFKDQSRSNLASGAILDAGSDRFIFKIKVNDLIINSPQSCSPAQLMTRFRLDASSMPPIVVSTVQSWVCFGPSNKFLKTC